MRCLAGFTFTGYHAVYLAGTVPCVGWFCSVWIPCHSGWFKCFSIPCHMFFGCFHLLWIPRVVCLVCVLSAWPVKSHLTVPRATSSACLRRTRHDFSTGTMLPVTSHLICRGRTGLWGEGVPVCVCACVCVCMCTLLVLL